MFPMYSLATQCVQVWKGRVKGKKKPTPPLLFPTKEQFLGRKGKKRKSKPLPLEPLLNEMLNSLPSPSLFLNFHLITLSHPTLERKTLTPPLTILFVNLFPNLAIPLA
jgi:hypothetical protein